MLLLNSEGPLNCIIQCAVNMRALISKVKGSSGTNATSPESKVQAMHFLREALHLGTGGWQKWRGAWVFQKELRERQVKNWEKSQARL